MVRFIEDVESADMPMVHGKEGGSRRRRAVLGFTACIALLGCFVLFTWKTVQWSIPSVAPQKLTVDGSKGKDSFSFLLDAAIQEPASAPHRFHFTGGSCEVSIPCGERGAAACPLLRTKLLAPTFSGEATAVFTAELERSWPENMRKAIVQQGSGISIDCDAKVDVDLFKTGLLFGRSLQWSMPSQGSSNWRWTEMVKQNLTVKPRQHGLSNITADGRYLMKVGLKDDSLIAKMLATVPVEVRAHFGYVEMEQHSVEGHLSVYTTLSVTTNKTSGEVVVAAPFRVFGRADMLRLSQSIGAAGNSVPLGKNSAGDERNGTLEHVLTIAPSKGTEGVMNLFGGSHTLKWQVNRTDMVKADRRLAVASSTIEAPTKTSELARRLVEDLGSFGLSSLRLATRLTVDDGEAIGVDMIVRFGPPLTLEANIGMSSLFGDIFETGAQLMVKAEAMLSPDEELAMASAHVSYSRWNKPQGTIFASAGVNMLQETMHVDFVVAAGEGEDREKTEVHYDVSIKDARLNVGFTGQSTSTSGMRLSMEPHDYYDFDCAWGPKGQGLRLRELSLWECEDNLMRDTEGMDDAAVAEQWVKSLRVDHCDDYSFSMELFIDDWCGEHAAWISGEKHACHSVMMMGEEVRFSVDAECIVRPERIDFRFGVDAYATDVLFNFGLHAPDTAVTAEIRKDAAGSPTLNGVLHFDSGKVAGSFSADADKAELSLVGPERNGSTRLGFQAERKPADAMGRRQVVFQGGVTQVKPMEWDLLVESQRELVGEAMHRASVSVGGSFQVSDQPGKWLLNGRAEVEVGFEITPKQTDRTSGSLTGSADATQTWTCCRGGEYLQDFYVEFPNWCSSDIAKIAHAEFRLEGRMSDGRQYWKTTNPAGEFAYLLFDRACGSWVVTPLNAELNFDQTEGWMACDMYLAKYHSYHSHHSSNHYGDDFNSYYPSSDYGEGSFSNDMSTSYPDTSSYPGDKGTYLDGTSGTGYPDDGAYSKNDMGDMGASYSDGSYGEAYQGTPVHMDSEMHMGTKGDMYMDMGVDINSPEGSLMVLFEMSGKWEYACSSQKEWNGTEYVEVPGVPEVHHIGMWSHGSTEFCDETPSCFRGTFLEGNDAMTQAIEEVSIAVLDGRNAATQTHKTFTASARLGEGMRPTVRGVVLGDAEGNRTSVMFSAAMSATGPNFADGEIRFGQRGLEVSAGFDPTMGRGGDQASWQHIDIKAMKEQGAVTLLFSPGHMVAEVNMAVLDTGVEADFMLETGSGEPGQGELRLELFNDSFSFLGSLGGNESLLAQVEASAMCSGNGSSELMVSSMGDIGEFSLAVESHVGEEWAHFKASTDFGPESIEVRNGVLDLYGANSCQEQWMDSVFFNHADECARSNKGGEFTVILESCSSSNVVVRICDQMCGSCGEPQELRNHWGMDSYSEGHDRGAGCSVLRVGSQELGAITNFECVGRGGAGPSVRFDSYPALREEGVGLFDADLRLPGQEAPFMVDGSFTKASAAFGTVGEQREIVLLQDFILNASVSVAMDGKTEEMLHATVEAKRGEVPSSVLFGIAGSMMQEPVFETGLTVNLTAKGQLAYEGGLKVREEPGEEISGFSFMAGSCAEDAKGESTVFFESLRTNECNFAQTASNNFQKMFFVIEGCQVDYLTVKWDCDESCDHCDQHFEVSKQSCVDWTSMPMKVMDFQCGSEPVAEMVQLMTFSGILEPKGEQFRAGPLNVEAMGQLMPGHLEVSRGFLPILEKEKYGLYDAFHVSAHVDVAEGMRLMVSDLALERGPDLGVCGLSAEELNLAEALVFGFDLDFDGYEHIVPEQFLNVSKPLLPEMPSSSPFHCPGPLASLVVGEDGESKIRGFHDEWCMDGSSDVVLYADMDQWEMGFGVQVRYENYCHDDSSKGLILVQLDGTKQCMSDADCGMIPCPGGATCMEGMCKLSSGEGHCVIGEAELGPDHIRELCSDWKIRETVEGAGDHSDVKPDEGPAGDSDGGYEYDLRDEECWVPIKENMWDAHRCEALFTKSVTCNGAELTNVAAKCDDRGCKVAVGAYMQGSTCEMYCSEHGLSCAGGWESAGASNHQCMTKGFDIGCRKPFRDDRAVCQCTGFANPREDALSDGAASVSMQRKLALASQCLQVLDQYQVCMKQFTGDVNREYLRKRSVGHMFRKKLLDIVGPRKCRNMDNLRIQALEEKFGAAAALC